METFRLSARRRPDVGQNLTTLRRSKQVPAVVYGHGIANEHLIVDGPELQRVYRQAGTTSLVDLVVDDKPAVKVLIHDLQRHPTNSSIVHADFYQVRMTEKLEADIELNIIGESPAVKEQGGILVRTLDTLKVECLPGDLVPSITVDISGLKTFEDRIHVKDLQLPPGLTSLQGPDEVVASVTPPRSEAELEALSQTVEEDVSTVEKVEKEKAADDEAAAEGESSPSTETKS